MARPTSRARADATVSMVPIVLGRIVAFFALFGMAVSGFFAAIASTNYAPKSTTGEPIQCHAPRSKDGFVTAATCTDDRFYATRHRFREEADFSREITAGEFRVRITLLLEQERIEGWEWDMDVATPEVAAHLGMSFEELQGYLQLDAAGVEAWKRPASD